MFISYELPQKNAKELHDSRVAFSKAEKFDKNNDLYNAILNYLKVIKSDKNFSVAKDRIKKNKPKVKTDAIAQLDKCAEANDFESALTIISDMEKIYPDDIDFCNYKIDFENVKEVYEILKLNNSQNAKIKPALILCFQKNKSEMTKEYGEIISSDWIEGIVYFKHKNANFLVGYKDCYSEENIAKIPNNAKLECIVDAPVNMLFDFCGANSCSPKIIANFIGAETYDNYKDEEWDAWCRYFQSEKLEMEIWCENEHGNIYKSDNISWLYLRQ